MPKDSSPEEKLLNLIKRKSKTPPQKGAQAAPSSKQKPTEMRHEENLASSTVVDFHNIVKLENVKILNRVLFITLIAIIIFFVVDIFLIRPKELPFIEEIKLERPLEAEELEVKPYSYYSKDITTKNIFKPVVKEIERPRTTAPKEDLMSHLALLGIISGENPQAIIEHRKRRKTLFLREGQTAEGIFLQKIGEGSVTVIYQGEEFNLSL